MQLLTRSNAPSIVLRGLVLCGLTLAQLAGPAPAAWAAPTPSTTITPPANAMIGEPIAFTVSFANTGGVGEVGYGPYLNVELPMEGADGAGVAIDDGVSFTSASYLGSPLTPLMAPFQCSGTYTHPLTGLSTACTVGTQVVVLQLPFGSFAVGQPGADVLITAALSNLADVSTPLTLRATGGFAYGSIPTGNTPIIGSTATATVTPQLFTLTKTYIGPEDETATGPNHPRQYRITVDIADGQTLTNLNLTDVLTDSLQYLSTDAVTTAIGSPTVTAVITPSLVLPGGTLTRRLSAATGTAGADDASMLFSYYVPLLRATGTDVLDPATGDDRLAPDDASASGTWTPIDGRDAAGPVSSNVTVNDHILEEQAIAIQKGVAVVIDNAPTGYSPDDVVEYTLDVQISDFFVFNSTVITDTFSDGQRWDTSFTPTLSVAGNGFTSASAGFDPANVTVDISQIGDDVNPATDGSTTVHFRLSDELFTRGEDGRFVGGCVPTTGTGGPAPDCAGFNDGATTAQIRVRAVVQQDFSDTYPSGDPSVDQGDVLTNTVTIDGAVLAVADATTPTGFSEADDSAAQFELAKGVLEKTIYALNGVVCPVCNSVIIEPGDTVTYRFTYTLPQTDFENLEFTDYLPLPVFDATTITVFTTTVSAGAPPSGMAKYGPSDTAFAVTGITPVITTTASSNTVAFGFGSYDDPGDSSTTVDVLFTVTVSDDPFVDGLFLTNQVRASEGTTNAGSQVDDSIVMIELGQPELAILKGVVATNGTGGVFAPATVGPVSFVAPGTAGLPWSGGPISSAALAATPINSNLSGIDAGDLVSFAITLENAGGADAFDVVVTDTLPSGFVVPPAGAGLNLRVYDGAGTAVAYTSLSGGLFGDGIRLNDPSATVGGLPAGRDTGGPIATGANVVMVVYDLQLADTIAPNSAQINTGQIASFAGAEAGPSHPTTGLSDTATVTSRNVGPAKTIVATSEAHTSGNSLAIGEIARYRLAVSLPEGLSTNFQLVDTVPPGLTVLNDGTINVAFVCNGGAGCISSSTLGTTPVLSGNSAITPTATLAAGAISPAVLSTGTDVTYSLGDLTNADRDSDTEYVVVEFNALLDNTSAGSNDAGETRTNSVAVRVGGSQLATANAPAITIVEPLLTLAKTANPTTLDNGDTVTYTVVITNATGASRSIAYDLVITDVVPSELTLNPASLSITSGSVSSSGNALTATVSSLATGGGVTLTYAARLDNLTFGVPITNTAAVAYTSLPGAGTIGNPTGSNTPGASGTDTGERDGSGGAVNDYRTTDPASITAPSSLTKTIVETSESSTSGGNGAIGEIVRYRVVGLLPESTVPALQLLDNLPAGLTYLNDGTARLAFVCNSGPSCASSTTLGSAPVLNGSAPVTPTYALPGGAITGGPFTNGVDPTFSAGTVTNVDDDADLEYIVLEFNVIVANIAGNTNGTNRDNTATAIVNGVASGTSPSVRVTVVRPTISLAKSVIAPAPVDAGDTLTYRLNYTNTAATASAFDLVVTDTIPALVTGPFTITSSTT
ncbi:MAG: DUF11 domain-containing protein, partial [Anaerolineales bacterium]|nr:DUF11 domain-containing protein [Anaerolineales bacterium]